jgi:hypothetical protein
MRLAGPTRRPARDVRFVQRAVLLLCVLWSVGVFTRTHTPLHKIVGVVTARQAAEWAHSAALVGALALGVWTLHLPAFTPPTYQQRPLQGSDSDLDFEELPASDAGRLQQQQQQQKLDPPQLK